MYAKPKKLAFGSYVPNDTVLNKKIPENPKYKHVRPAIDTGKNIRTHIDELKEKQKNCVHKKDEIFFRIRVSAFIKLALAVAKDRVTNESDVCEQSNNADKPMASDPSDRRCISNVLMGVGELDALNDRKKIRSMKIKQVKLPYLLLDVRDRDAFSKCHIVTAKNYPSSYLSRSDYETEDLKKCKNVISQLIIIYDDDESIAVRVATTLVERGYENIYLLTGGLKLALEVCPHGLTTSSHMLTPVHMLSQNTCQAQKSGKESFSQEDIDIIQQYIDSYPNRGNKSVYSHSLKSKSSGSCHKSKLSKSNGSCHKSNFGLISSPSHASTTSTSRRGSLCSSSTIGPKHQPSASFKTSQISHTNSKRTQNMEHAQSKSEMNAKLNPKKAPWK